MKRMLFRALPGLLLSILVGCTAVQPWLAEPATSTPAPATATPVPTMPGAATATATTATDPPPDGRLADVVSVEVGGEPGAYRFRVGVSSPDTGCDRYADWWEVVSEEGELIYRRVLLHSHVDEQPFTRAGSPVPVAADRVVYVRAHLQPGGYGGAAFKGSVQAGFEAVELPADFAVDLAEELPLPQGCAF
jgi:hypothetical protein